MQSYLKNLNYAIILRGEVRRKMEDVRGKRVVREDGRCKREEFICKREEFFSISFNYLGFFSMSSFIFLHLATSILTNSSQSLYIDLYCLSSKYPLR